MSAWRTIDSAPHDRKIIIARFVEGHCLCAQSDRWYQDDDWGLADGWTDWATPAGRGFVPTHWMDIEPPA